jgi:hypothetical protein
MVTSNRSHTRDCVSIVKPKHATEGATAWLLLAYKVPREPTSARVYVWRKMKQLGALALQDAVWVLPATSRTQEQFQWLEAEIVELGGEVTLWTAQPASENQGQSLQQQFEQQVDVEYREILDQLKKKARDLTALSRRYQQAHSRDFFQSELGQKVRQALLAAEGESKR